MTTQMLELAIETEGLIRILRDGQSSPETLALLKKKCQELAALAASLPEESREKQEVGAESRENTECSAKPENSEKEESREMREEEASAALDALETEATEAAATPESDATATSETDDIFILEGDDNLLEEPASAEPAPEKATADNKGQNGKKGLKSLFSLNDRYLYARELFGGNMKMFDATLDFIEGVEYYSDIEDYFYNELEWEPENVTAATFLDTLRPHFKE